ncbi:YcnI family protein [Micromonospora avicenniae]|uniref:YcnI family protein n=1 Tax=Micromonospora avicenniae TaxID=1198245 RepID=UPI0034211429
MAMTRGHRRAAATAVLATAAALSWPGGAYAAEVTTTPGQARQGDAVRLEFVVPEERAGTRTRQIEVRLPTDTPIAEVYPMSVPGWAPRIQSRILDEPLSGIHSTGVSTVTTAVTWIRVDGAEPGPARLSLSMGPLPRTGRLAFPVIQTYADGTVVRWTDPTGAHPAPRLTLLPAAGREAAGHAGHGAPADAGAVVPGTAPGGAGANRPNWASGPDGASRPGGAGVPGDATGGAGLADNTGGDTADDAGVAGDRAGGAGVTGLDGVAGRGGAGQAGGDADALLAAGLIAGLGGGAAIGWLASGWRRRSLSGRDAEAVHADPDGDAPAGDQPERSGLTPTLIHSGSGRSG